MTHLAIYDSFPIALSYAEFMQRVNALNEDVGEDSFVLDPLVDGNVVPKTHEEALAHYDTMLREDQYTRAFARYYCDYMGISDSRQSNLHLGTGGATGTFYRFDI